jgi:deazaflavin-dependent oxidoreductase (nitroreductase family)
VSHEYVAERKRNALVNTSTGARVLSAVMLPWFIIWPPKAFGVLTTTGRKTGKPRRKCVRVIRVSDTAYLVSIRSASWLHNIRANPKVRLRLRGGRVEGAARELSEANDKEQAIAAYCSTVSCFDYFECLAWCKGRPTRSKIEELHQTWCDVGTILGVDLHERTPNRHKRLGEKAAGRARNRRSAPK